jgi:hypothetical protein
MRAESEILEEPFTLRIYYTSGGRPERLGDRIVGDRVHQSDFKGTLDGDLFRSDEKFECSTFPDQAR